MRRYGRGKGRVRMGLIGKAGVIAAGGIPVALASVDAIAPWMEPAYATASVSEKMRLSIYAFGNNLSVGFGLGPGLPATSLSGFATPNAMNLAPGGYLKTTAAGVGLVVIDGVIGTIMRFASGGRARPKLMGRQLISG